jgi:hypothetical protein
VPLGVPLLVPLGVPELAAPDPPAPPVPLTKASPHVADAKSKAPSSAVHRIASDGRRNTLARKYTRIQGPIVVGSHPDMVSVVRRETAIGAAASYRDEI